MRHIILYTIKCEGGMKTKNGDIGGDWMITINLAKYDKL